ncbi:MAG: dockerin type I domain-containing protein [Planctomycetota bacterium]
MAATATTASAAIEAIVDRASGEFFVKNAGGAIEFFDAYEISSPDADLIPAAWTSVAGNYDLVGDESVSSSSWFPLTSSAMFLAEAGPVASGALLPGEAVSLGAVWSTTGVEDLDFRFFLDTAESVLATDFRSLSGDYDGDLDVDAIDYAIWQATFLSTTNLAADGNGDGIVDASDYTVWRDDFMLVNAGPLPATLQAPAVFFVPEPTALGLSVMMAFVAVGRRRRGED